MRAGELDLYIERGCDWQRIFTIYKQDGSPLELSDAQITMQIRDSAQSNNIICVPTIEILQPATQGKVSIYMNKDATKTLPASGRHYGQTSKCVYDIYIYNQGRRERVLNGFVEISPEVTR